MPLKVHVNFHCFFVFQIMGLNPPFGVKAALANRFINQALKFNPKILILIVPKETKRYYSLFTLLEFDLLNLCRFSICISHIVSMIIVYSFLLLDWTKNMNTI